jgi:hypothetical protein
LAVIWKANHDRELRLTRGGLDDPNDPLSEGGGYREGIPVRLYRLLR